MFENERCACRGENRLRNCQWIDSCATALQFLKAASNNGGDLRIVPENAFANAGFGDLFELMRQHG